MTLDDLFKAYKPKEGFSIYAFQSIHTNRFVGLVMKKAIINNRSKDVCNGAVKVISEEKIEDYFKQVKDFIEKRELEPLKISQ